VTGFDKDPIGLGLSEALAGTYRVEGELARGAMAHIFVARDLRHDRTVAVKVLPLDLATPDAAQRFLHEIRITADLQHPNILPLLDSGASAELTWYVMPLVEGMSLRQRLAEGPLPVREALRIAMIVAQALDYAHQRGVIHRDIKPENVLFTGGQPLVADFGLARAVAGRHQVGTPATGLPLGTPAYMSPEQATGSEVDHRTDYYALGCVLYEMLTGQPPFAGSVTEVIRQHVEATPGPPSALRPGLSPMVDQIVDRLLAKDPGDRYQKAAELVQDLETAIARETLELSEEAPKEEAPFDRPAARRRPWLFLAAPAVLAAVVIVLILAPWRGGGGSVAVAVLPLEVGGTDAIARSLADGFADDLVTELGTRFGSRIEVRSVASSAAFAGRGLTARSIGDSLGVGYLFQGEVHPAGGSVRVELRLIDTGRDAQAWARSWDVTAGDAPQRRHVIVEAAAAALDSLMGGR
jgi:eukaryotic-like serine/threonine-protein kinase